MKKALQLLSIILIIALCGLLGYIVWGNLEASNPNAGVTPTPDNWTPPPIVTPIPTPGPTPRPNAENASVINLALVGDLVMHTGLNAEALTDNGYNYLNVFGGLAPYFQEADFAAATMQTTLVQGPDYSGYPEFRSPDALAYSLRDAGFDLVNTATDHAMDSYKGGAERTLAILEDAGLQHVGTYRSNAERNNQNGIKIAEVGGIKIAFLAYTFGTNGIPITEFDYITNVFFKDNPGDPSDIDYNKIIDYDKIKNDMEAANALEPDIIVTFLHWGTEYYEEPMDYQRELADFLLYEGADIIVGGHPHVLEPMEMREMTDRYGREKTGLIAYSLGNFISCPGTVDFTNLTALLRVEIEKNIDTGEAYITGVKYAPFFMVDLMKEEYGIADQDWRYKLWDLHAAITSYETEGYDGLITESLYNAMCNGLTRTHTVLGAQYDMFHTGSDAEISG